VTCPRFSDFKSSGSAIVMLIFSQLAFCRFEVSDLTIIIYESSRVYIHPFFKKEYREFPIMRDRKYMLHFGLHTFHNQHKKCYTIQSKINLLL
jgi:hypothetical protein